MLRKLWPKAPAKEGALGQMSKNFQVYFIHINFFKKQIKKIYNTAKELYCKATIFVFRFFTCPKKMETEKWPQATYSPILGVFLLETPKSELKNCSSALYPYCNFTRFSNISNISTSKYKYCPVGKKDSAKLLFFYFCSVIVTGDSYRINVGITADAPVSTVSNETDNLQCFKGT